MTEKTLVVPSLVLNYTGQFSLRDIEDVIRRYMSKTTYALIDVSHDISVQEHSKSHTLKFFFMYEPHVLEECQMRVIVSAQNVKPIIREINGHSSQLLEGELVITMRARTYSNADEHKTLKPVSYALWTLFRKFLFDAGTTEIGLEMKKYCYDLYDEIYGLLHMGEKPEGNNA